MSSRKARKLYVHFEDRGTCVLQDVDDESAVEDICVLFLRAADFSNGFKPDQGELQAYTAKGRPLNLSQSIKKAIGKEADIYLRLNSDRKHRINESVQSKARREVATSRIKGVGQLCSAQGYVLAASSEQGPAVEGSHRRVQSPLIAPLLQKAEEKETSQHYKAAAFIYKQVLKPFAFRCTIILSSGLCC